MINLSWIDFSHAWGPQCWFSRKKAWKIFPFSLLFIISFAIALKFTSTRNHGCGQAGSWEVAPKGFYFVVCVGLRWFPQRWLAALALGKDGGTSQVARPRGILWKAFLPASARLWRHSTLDEPLFMGNWRGAGSASDPSCLNHALPCQSSTACRL